MPATTIDQLEKRETRLRAKLREQKGKQAADGTQTRKLRKRIRRAQRKRRRLAADAARRAPKAPAAES